VVTAWYVPAQDAASEDSLRDYLKAKLSPYKVPKRFLSIEELPRNAMGKVKKNELRELGPGRL
jgi:acyl-CoA synthetase (AMP-forming)/AMP-acid ligase II